MYVDALIGRFVRVPRKDKPVVAFLLQFFANLFYGRRFQMNVNSVSCEKLLAACENKMLKNKKEKGCLHDS